MNSDNPDLLDDLEELESAEDFLVYFKVPFEQSIVHVNRLHILQRYHNYLQAHRERSGEPVYADYHALLTRAYEDFVHSDAYTEKVMRVHQKASGIATVSVSSIRRAGV
jgi:nitrogenase-stabilizing/protective protein